jgi:hypothetical protein
VLALVNEWAADPLLLIGDPAIAMGQAAREIARFEGRKEVKNA